MCITGSFCWHEPASGHLGIVPEKGDLPEKIQQFLQPYHQNVAMESPWDRDRQSNWARKERTDGLEIIRCHARSQCSMPKRTLPELKASSVPKAEPSFLKKWGHAEEIGTKNFR